MQIDEAEFITNPQSGNVPLEVAFDASSLERSNSASSFEWDFDGDGVYDQKNKEATAEYTFEKIGIYNVGLRIVDIHNNFRVYSKKVEVVQDTQKKLKASIRVSPSVKGNAPFKVSLSGADSFFLDGDIEEYEWDFGDKSAKQFGRTVSHVYKNAGLYEVTLTIYAENGEKESDSLEIQVEGDSSIPVAKIVSKPALEKDQKTLQ